MRRTRAPKRRRGAAGAFSDLGLGISGRIINLISLMNLISLIKPIGGRTCRGMSLQDGGFNEPFLYYIHII